MSTFTTKSRRLGVKLGAVAFIAALGLGTGVSAASAAAVTAAHPASVTAAVNAPAVPKGYIVWDSKIPTIQACVEEGENLRAEGLISAWECIAEAGGYTLYVKEITSCPGVVGVLASRGDALAARPAAC